VWVCGKWWGVEEGGAEDWEDVEYRRTGTCR
jgi:hypothetical protein